MAKTQEGLRLPVTAERIAEIKGDDVEARSFGVSVGNAIVGWLDDCGDTAGVEIIIREVE